MHAASREFVLRAAGSCLVVFGAVAMSVSVRAGDSSVAFTMGVEGPLTRVYDDHPYEGKKAAQVTLRLAANEYESFQIVVAAGAKPLANVRITFSDLKGSEGTKIPAVRLSARQVGYIKLKESPYIRAGQKLRWTPDILLPFTSCGIAAHAIQPFWITLHAPANAKAGTYRGSMKVKTATGTRTVKLGVAVWPFAIPVRKTLRVVTAFPYPRGWKQEERYRLYDFALDYGFNPTSIYADEMLPLAADLEYCKKRGMNAINIRRIKQGVVPKWAANVERDVKKGYEALKKRGLEKYGFAYICDEPDRKHFPNIIQAAQLVHRAAPGVKTVGCVSILPDFFGHVDIWDPTIAKNSSNCEFSENDDVGAIVRKRHARGEEVWWNVCVNPPPPYPNVTLDRRLTDARVIFWLTWKYGIKGFEYWRLIASTSENYGGQHTYADLIKGYPHSSFNAYTWRKYLLDGSLAFPGPERSKPVSSMRLEAVRDGIEDYESFAILRGLLKQANPRLRQEAGKLLAVPVAVAKNRKTFAMSPEPILRAREALGEMIARIKMEDNVHGH